MGNHVGRHYQAPGGVKGVEPSHIVNENTKLVIDANTDPTTNGMVSASLEKYFTTIATTALPPDYNLNSGKFFLKEPDDGVSTMPTFVSGSNGSASYWEFDGNTNALTATTAFGTEANFGEDFSTGTTVSFWLKESPIAPSGSQFNVNTVTGSDKQRATLFGMDSTAHEFTQDQRSLLLRQKFTELGTHTTAVTARGVKILNNISGHRVYSAANGATASLSYFEFHYPKPDGLSANSTISLGLQPGGINVVKNHHVSNPNPNASSSYSGRTSDSTAVGFNKTYDFNMLGKHGTGKGPESGSFLRCLYTTTAGAGATNLELNFKVSCSSNQTTFPDFAPEGRSDRDGDTAKVWLDHSDPTTSASLETMRKLAGNDGNINDMYSFALNNGEDRLSLYRNEYTNLESGSFRSGSESHMVSSANPNPPWVNMAFVSEGIISTSLDVTLDANMKDIDTNTPEVYPDYDNTNDSAGDLSGSAIYDGTSGSFAQRQTHGTYQMLGGGYTAGFDEPSNLNSFVQSFSPTTREVASVYGKNTHQSHGGEAMLGNGPGILVGRRNVHTIGSGSYSNGSYYYEKAKLGDGSGTSPDTASLSFWQGHIGKDLEVWTQSGSADFIYKGKHKIRAVVAQSISGSVGNGYDLSGDLREATAQAENFVSIRLGGQFDTQGIVGANQAPGEKGKRPTHQHKLRLRVTSPVGKKHKVYKNGKLIQSFEDKGYIIQDGSATNGYRVPFQPFGNNDNEPAGTSRWTGSIGQSGTSGSALRNDGDLIIGRSTGASPKYWRGKVAHFSVYNQALNDSDVKGNYFALKDRFEGK